MHELSLCESLCAILEEEARRHSFARVTRLRLSVGRFAGVETEALRFGFTVVARGGVAEGAELEIEELPGRAWCFDCGAEVELEDRLAPCPRCGGGALRASGGDELRIRDLEVV